MMTISFSNIEDAFFYVSCQPQGSNQAYLSLATGKFYYVSEFGDSDELPDDIEESDQYLEIPHKNELGQGRDLVNAFTIENAPQLEAEVSRIFQRPGAYRNFKDLMAENELLEKWYECENDSEARAIKQWCEENKIPIENESNE